MYRSWFGRIFKLLNIQRMDKAKNHIQVFATEDGKMYIKPSDLFAQEHVQQIIERMSNSPILVPKKVKGKPKQR